MDIQGSNQYNSSFDYIAREITDDNGDSVEVWYAWELTSPTEYIEKVECYVNKKEKHFGD